MPAWQLKMTGQEAVVSLSMATIWSKLASSGAFSWFMGMRMGSSLGTLSLMVAMLKDTTASCPVIFNCQAGISRTTTAMVTAALVKELQLTRELDRMRGIVPDDILDALKKKKLGLPGIDFEVQEDRNAMQTGEFEVIKELLAAYPAAKIAKAQVDKLIDLAAPPPRGTGVENIRECIIESKMTFDVSSDDWQAYLKAKIMNNIERYFYLIVFAMYIREVGPKGFPQTFKL